MKDFTHLELETLVSALKVAELGVWEWNVAENTLTWSTELKLLYGLGADDSVTYDKYIQLIHPDDRLITQKIIERAIKTKQKYITEHRVVWPNGEVHWVRGQGQAFFHDNKLVRMLGTAYGIDTLKKAQDELHESEIRFQNMADNAPVMMWMTNANGEITYFNKPWLEFRGTTLLKELNNNWMKYIHKNDIERVKKLLKSKFQKRRPYALEYRIKNHFNDYRWILEHGAPYYTNSGTFKGYFGSCVDIDDIKTIVNYSDELEGINLMLEEQYDELVLLNQAKDDFISLASHQLRTPATGVKQYLGMLIEGYAGSLTNDQQLLLETAYTSNERQLKIIDDLLRVAHIDSGKVLLNFSKVNIKTLIHQIIDEFKSTIDNRKQKIHLYTPVSEIHAEVDSDRLRMAIENVIDNASKYSHQSSPINIHIKKAARSVIISVEDKGVGIAKEDIPKVFKKFSRISNPLSMKVGGTGLGLYWALKIIELHGGSINIDTKLNAGTRFDIEIPLKKAV